MWVTVLGLGYEKINKTWLLFSRSSVWWGRHPCKQIIMTQGDRHYHSHVHKIICKNRRWEWKIGLENLGWEGVLEVCSRCYELVCAHLAHPPPIVTSKSTFLPLSRTRRCGHDLESTNQLCLMTVGRWQWDEALTSTCFLFLRLQAWRGEGSGARALTVRAGRSRCGPNTVAGVDLAGTAWLSDGSCGSRTLCSWHQQFYGDLRAPHLLICGGGSTCRPVLQCCPKRYSWMPKLDSTTLALTKPW